MLNRAFLVVAVLAIACGARSSVDSGALGLLQSSDPDASSEGGTATSFAMTLGAGQGGAVTGGTGVQLIVGGEPMATQGSTGGQLTQGGTTGTSLSSGGQLTQGGTTVALLGGASSTAVSNPLCGNRVLDPGEACDDGNQTAGDGCAVDCQYGPERFQTCGNGWLESGEFCDDGNRVSGDGCDSGCCMERFWNSLCPWSQPKNGRVCCAVDIPCFCGNGMTELAEECDDGNLRDDDGCSRYCQFEPGDTCPNGVLDAHEQCDDGNSELLDGCDDHCRKESCQTMTVLACGDGVVQLSEQCDDGNTTSGDGCSSNCTMEDGTDCADAGQTCPWATQACGNAVVEPVLGEQCDDGVNDGTYGGCAFNCMFAPRCGDGVVQSDYEECDSGGNLLDRFCTQDCKLN